MKIKSSSIGEGVFDTEIDLEEGDNLEMGAAHMVSIMKVTARAFIEACPRSRMNTEQAEALIFEEMMEILVGPDHGWEVKTVKVNKEKDER